MAFQSSGNASFIETLHVKRSRGTAKAAQSQLTHFGSNGHVIHSREHPLSGKNLPRLCFGGTSAPPGL
jgi:hypothetical protein